LTKSGAIIKFIIDNEGKTDYNNSIGAFGRCRYLAYGACCRVEKCIGEEQVSRRTARNAKLGKNDNFCAERGSVPCGFNDVFCVAVTVRYGDITARGGNLYKSVFHFNYPFDI
jgi:hypothetical protein